ncbi:flavodoxin domain-containing protein [Geofilum sp. OHC36d9]|uniref:flavodoxin domain-containing protein n=1 Tax=Geofilum sp. OHC36d9 TaxID=3458413 RepID=UPI004033AE27
MEIFKRLKTKKKKEKPLLILYGTKSGNAKLIAQQTQKYYQKTGIESLCKNMARYQPSKLKEVNYLLIIISTHGDGAPPPSTKTFFNECMSNAMPGLCHLNYSICALGDSAYEKFCRAGKILDKRLSNLGATPFYPRKDCDTEFSRDAIQWIKQTALYFKNENFEINKKEINLPAIATNNQYYATIKTREIITKGKNVTPVCHLVLDISKSNLKYSVGDSIGIKPRNPLWLVEQIINEFNYTSLKTNNIDLIKNKLLNDYEITQISKKTLQNIYATTKSKSLKSLLESKDQLEIFVSQANLYDLVKDFNLGLNIDELMVLLPKLKRRLYTIASSQELHPNELHLTIKTIRNNFQNRKHEGAASVYTNERLNIKSPVSFILYKNAQFALPTNPNQPIIMIGVSTGIASFRAILQKRQAHRIKGNTWLIWGNKKSNNDFLYENELTQFRKTGILEKLNLAFSRDAINKHYVQDEIKINSTNIIQWINNGAHIFISGSITMGKSVKQNLDEILISHNNSTNSLIREGRYHEDIY